MPQKITDMKRVQDVKNFVEKPLLKYHTDGIDDGLPSNFHCKLSEWTQDDVTALAKSHTTYSLFESLLGVANTAVEKDKNGNFTQDALLAQQALEAVKPDCCHSWVGFGKMIISAADDSQLIRDGYHKKIDAQKGKKTGAVIELHKDVEYCGELPKGESPQAQALAIAANLKTAVRAA